MNGCTEDKKWFAIYVKSRYEKKVFKLLADMNIESFLPLVTRIKQWSDRKKKVEEPLFRSYIFVHISSRYEYENVVHCNGVVKFVSFENKAVPVPDNQIYAIKCYIEDNDILDDINYDNYKEGELVRIKSGQLKDLIGRFVKINGKHRVIINIESVGKCLPITISKSKIEAIKDNNITSFQ